MKTNVMNNDDVFFQEYTSHDAILKYSRATAGVGISALLDGEYKDVYLRALELLPPAMKRGPIRMLEFGCGAGMNLLHLVAVLSRAGFNIASAIGTDFSPVLIETAKEEAQKYLGNEEQKRVQFCVAKNETLVQDLAVGLGTASSEVENSFEFILGVNTIRYSHRAGKQLDCAEDIFRLLAPGGVCVVIDMNDRFPVFRSALKDKLRGKENRQEECYLPSLEEYTAPFREAGFAVSRSEHFCWIPHSAGPGMTSVMRALSPVLNTVAGSRAMRSLVVATKPRR
jgi:SAM-dependent methyltransferase